MKIRVTIRDVSGKTYKSIWLPATQAQYENMVELFMRPNEMKNFNINVRNKTVYFFPGNIASATIDKKDN